MSAQTQVKVNEMSQSCWPQSQGKVQMTKVWSMGARTRLCARAWLFNHKFKDLLQTHSTSCCAPLLLCSSAAEKKYGHKRRGHLSPLVWYIVSRLDKGRIWMWSIFMWHRFCSVCLLGRIAAISRAPFNIKILKTVKIIINAAIFPVWKL